MFYEVAGGRKQLLAQKSKTGVRLFLLKNSFLNLRTLSFRKKVSLEGVQLSSYRQD